jgi:hypothetical protein
MANKYYDPSGYPQTGAPGSSAAMRSELATIATGFEGVEQDIDDALTGASGAVTTATTQAGIATTQAGISTTQAGIATTQAGISTTQAGIATTQAGIASDKAAEAAATKLAVDATYDEFDDRYLGRKASDPTVDNDGNALQKGTLYFNTTTDTFKGYNGSAWINLPATAASNLTFTPAGGVSATDVQAAIEELDTEKLSAGAGAVGESNLADAAIPSKVHSASSKTPPVDADEIPLIDSADSFSLKRLTWANLKAALKTYFDTLYNTVSLVTAAVDTAFSSTADNAAATPAWVRGAYPIRTYITAWSAPYTPAFGENLFAAHGKSSVPNGARLILECVSADLGYAVGERYVPTGQWNGTATPPLAGGYCDATNCGVRCPSGYLVYIANKSTGIAATPAASKWKYAFEYTI